MAWQHRTVEANGIRFHCVQDGAGPLVLLLHGFPEFWYSWRHQIPLLAQHCCVVAPDLRGYNLTERHGPYDVRTLVADILGLIDAFGGEPAALVGHDWGGMIAWYAAGWHPERVRRLAILNCPHPTVFQQHLPRTPAQWLRSSYVAFFQLPWLPELLFSSFDYAPVRRTMRRTATAGSFTDQDLQQYRDALRRSGLSAPLGYYRALRQARRLDLLQPLNVSVPTLHIWGEQDPWLGVELLDGTTRYVPDYQLRRIRWSGHWVQNEAPELVNSYLSAFLRDKPMPA